MCFPFIRIFFWVLHLFTSEGISQVLDGSHKPLH